MICEVNYPSDRMDNRAWSAGMVEYVSGYALNTNTRKMCTPLQTEIRVVWTEFMFQLNVSISM